MTDKIQIENILFLDIETVPQTYVYEELDEDTKHLFESKTRSQITELKSYEEIYHERGGILAEFGKIVCISVG